MKKNFKHALAIVVFIMGFSYILSAQSAYKITDSKSNDMKLSGTSSLHDWDMNTRIFTGEAHFVITPGNSQELTSLVSLNFSLPVENLKSDKKGLDKRAYEALKTDQYKSISYSLTTATVLPEKDGRYLLKTLGELTIAGVTKIITMDVYCVVNKDGTITCTGSDKLKMTDYEVEPPSFMLGAMQTSDDITLDFALVYSK